MLQVVLLLLGAPTPLIWLYRAMFVPAPWSSGEVQGMAMSLAVSAVALLGIWLIRRGRFQQAIRQVLVLIALATVYAYATQGAGPQTFEEPILVAWIALAGLMIGRRALWLMFAAILAAFLAGAVYAIQHPEAAQPPAAELGMLVTKAIMFLLITVVIGKGVAALRAALAESSQRGDALMQANVRLQEEMAERRRSEDKLIHAQKVEAVGRLAAGIAHDFNHLLGLVMAYVSKGRRAATPGEFGPVLDGVESAAQRGVALTGRLLNFSRHDAARVERVDPVAAVRALEPLLRQQLDSGVSLHLDLPPGTGAVLVDPTQLDLVVLNIAANAQSAMPEGGRFDVQVRDSDDGAHVEIELRDTGHGMGPDVLARLYEPFFTTRPAGQGSGLGLSVVSSIMAAYGGSVQASSRQGHGASFLLRLPRQA